MNITDVIESNETKRRAWFSSGFWLPAGHSVVVVDSADPDVDGSAEIRERNEIAQELNRLNAENTLLLGQRERAMQAALWLRAYRPSAKKFKAACAEMDALEKEVQG
jgi:hypothetical protein